MSKIYVIAYGPNGEGYKIQSLHAKKESAYAAAHEFMGDAWGFRDNPVDEEEVPYVDGFVWSYSCDRVYMFSYAVQS